MAGNRLFYIIVEENVFKNNWHLFLNNNVLFRKKSTFFTQLTSILNFASLTKSGLAKT